MQSSNKYLIPFIAFLAYGTWAAFVNYEHGFKAFFLAGLAQGSYAFLSTLFITEAAKKTYIKLGCNLKGQLLGFLSSFTIMASFPFIIHSMVGTPNIIESILPGLAWGTLYIFVVLIRLPKQYKAQP